MKIWRNYKEIVWFLGLVLSAIGLFNVFNASYVLALKTEGTAYYFLRSQALACVVGLIIAVFVASRRFDYRKLSHTGANYLIAVVVIGLLIAVDVVGITVNGSQRWLKLGVTFQPSELAKVSVLFLSATFLASYFGNRPKSRYAPLISPPTIITAVMCILVLKQPDMGTALVIFGICILIYIVAGLQPKIIVGCGVLAALGIIPIIVFASYRLDRIKAWINPWAYAQGIGYQSCQSMLTIGSGKLFGMQFGKGISKFFYLPEAHTDFAFAIWSQEAGFIGSLILVILIFAFAKTGFAIASRTEDLYGRYLAIGITGLIAGQAFINISMVTGLFPVVGVPLPFISYGGTSLVINWFALGVLANIAGRIKGDRREQKA